MSTDLERGGPPLFYGWKVTLACSLVMFVSIGAWFYTFAVFFKPITQEFGWSRAQWSIAMSLMMVVWGVVAPVVGRLSDRIGPRQVMLLASFPFLISFVGLALAQSLWHFYVFYGFQAVGVTGLTMIPISTLMTRWFRARRGLALAIAMVGSAGGGLVVAPLAGYLVLSIGWRQAYLALGLSAWLAILFLLLVIRSDPREMGLAANGVAPEGEAAVPGTARPRLAAAPAIDWKLSQAVRSSLLWKLIAALLLVDLAVLAVYTHLVNFLTDRGIAPLLAATALGVAAALEGVGKLTIGFLADRVSKIRLTLLCLVLQAVAVFILLRASNTAMIWAFVLLFGAATGGIVTLRPLLVGEFFGTTAFGGIFGILESVRRVGSVTGPILAGLIYDAFLSYNLAFVMIIAAYALAGVFVLTLSAPGPRR